MKTPSQVEDKHGVDSNALIQLPDDREYGNENVNTSLSVQKRLKSRLSMNIWRK